MLALIDEQLASLRLDEDVIGESLRVVEESSN